MASQTVSTQTDRSSGQLFHMKLQGGLKFISALLLPLALGVFTIVITFEQQNVAKKQRYEDRYASQLQREQDKVLNEQRYKNELLNTYIHDMAELLDKKNGSLTFNQVTATVARVKTLNILRELDPQRDMRIIRFLHEAGQLKYLQNYSSLDLSTAELRDIDFRESAINKKSLNDLQLNGMFLSNVTFINIALSNMNFAETEFDNVSFSSSHLSNVNFSSTKFNNSSLLLSRHEYVDFSFSKLDTVNFSSSRLENKINFTFAKVNNTDFSNTRFVDVILSRVKLYNINFSFASFTSVNIGDTWLSNCHFFSSTFVEGRFSSTRFNNINLKYSTFKRISFFISSFYDADLSFAKLEETQFKSTLFKITNYSSAVIVQVQFNSSELHKVSFWSAKLSSVAFFNSILKSVSFNNAKLLGVNFENTTAIATDFAYSNLSNSKFLNSNFRGAIFKGADLIHVNFNGTNLHGADFTGTNISDGQLYSALSIQDTILPNGSLSQDKSLIYNGEADCNISPGKNWKLERSNSIIQTSQKNDTDCQFTLQPFAEEAVMSQHVNISGKWYSSSWPYSQAILSARMSVGVSIQLRGISINGEVSGQQTLNSTKENISLVLRHDMQELQLLVKFSRLGYLTPINPWCDDIKLYIMYGTYSESSHVIHNIPLDAEWGKDAITVAGEDGYGDGMNQLAGPRGVYVDDDETVYVVDQSNHRIIERKASTSQDKVVAGGIGAHKLDRPYDVIVDKESDSLIISSWGDNRVVRWSRQNSSSSETIISNVYCAGLSMDDNGALYVVNWLQHEVNRYRLGDTKGTIVAGGNGHGNQLNQLYNPWYVFVNRDYSVYVSDRSNHRVMKWKEGAQQGIVVAGGQGQGSGLGQLQSPLGVIVDHMDTVYVADRGNDRVVRWIKGATQGSVIVGGNGRGTQPSQFKDPWGISFDRHGNLYVADHGNNRVQRFTIKNKNSRVLSLPFILT